MSERAQPLLELKGIRKAFAGVVSLDDVDFDLYPGEVHALVGENGAGKSTMIKVICGVHQPDAGEIVYKGRPVRWNSPLEARHAGISVIHQELNVAPNISVAENVLMGAKLPRNRLGFIDWRAVNEKARELLRSIGSDLDPRRPVATLSVAQQQIIEIARALSIRADIIIMDEPTATLTGREIDKLFELIELLKSRGVGIIYVSHRLEEIFSISNRVTVLRDGKRISTKPINETDSNTLIRDMVGRELSAMVLQRHAGEKTDQREGTPLLEVRSLSDGGVLKDGSFVAFPGEIVGIYGLVGAGRSELLQTIFGASRRVNGDVRIAGETVQIQSPRDAIGRGIALVPESRKEQSLFLDMAVGENVSVLRLPDASKWGWRRGRVLSKLESEYIAKLGVKTPSVSTKVVNLSGGNQQKAIIARWLMVSPRVLLLDEPTRGVDVGAKAEIYQIIRELAVQGTAVVVVSSDLPEILHLSDRIYVMHAGRIVTELRGDEMNEETIMFYATGGRNLS